MNRNKREIILDFTSLLDVILILLFFFVIFAQFDSNQAIQDANEKANAQIEQAKEDQQKAADQLEEAKEEWAVAEQARLQAEKELEEVKQANERAAANIDGILDFDKGVNLKILLSGKNNDWNIDVQFGEEKFEILDVRNRNSENLAKEFSKILIDCGYTKDSAILCDVLCDSSERGSNKAIENTKNMIELSRKDYAHFFYSATDLSGTDLSKVKEEDE